MYVRSLRLAGFKSFADPTVLEFERGINVIVGPNGSGKSNIADALSWVLGSQAPSSLRGASMEDVVFAGSQSRPRLGLAEVEMVLDNASRILPLDLAEVTIARSTDRTGASEYSINGAPCRLLDVAELLSDTGIGRSLHAVVGQGQLDAVLHARAEDRRAFIEEAAQIGKYRRRKDRALRKIERVDDNLVRLNDVLHELRRALRPLKRQATAAAQHSELMREQRELRQRLAAAELARLHDEARRWDPEADEKRSALLGDELASVRARLERAGSERTGLAAAADATRGTADRIGRAVDRLASLARLADERSERIAARLAAETEEGYRERIRLLDAERARWDSELGGLRDASERARAAASDARVTADAARARRRDAEGALARARAEETAAAQALVRAEGSEAAGRATLGSVEARARAVGERRDVAGHELEADGRRVAAAETEVRALETELDAATEAAAAAEARLEEARERADRLRERLGGSHAERAAAEARLAALEEIVALFGDRPDVTARLVPLVDDARERVELASASEDDARRILGEADAEVERLWVDVGKQDDELRRLDALMSGAAERLAGARRRHEKRETEVATLSDELARAQEALAGAERAAAEERAGLPARRAALDEARGARRDAEGTVEAARAAEGAAVSEATEAEMQARAAEERALAAQLRVEEAESGIADASAALAGLADLRASLAAARARAAAVAGAARRAAAAGEAWARRAADNAAAARARAEEGERAVASLRARERELSDALDDIGRRRRDAEVRRAEARARADAVAERAMDEWGMSAGDLAGLDLAGLDEDDARARVERLERDIRRLGPVNPRAAEEHAELSEREGFLVGQIDDLKSSKADLLKVVGDVDATIVEVFRSAFEDVAREFEVVFERLFPSGSGRLRLTDASDLLHAGIEVEARPPGKNVRKLSLLSGGERSLVALAFLFAIFRSRPSPFYLLDEVEAALDDVNLQRFLTLVGDLREHAQVLVVTHQKRTMEAADLLYGVSMSSDGVSRVVAKRMEELVG